MRRHSALALAAGVLVGAMGMAPALANADVSIVSPTAGYVAGSFDVVVSADSPDGVASVELFANGVSVGTDTATPFEFAMSGSDGSSISLVARMTDGNGGLTDSDAVAVTVDDAAPSAVITTADGSVLLNLPQVNEQVGGDAIRGTSSDAGSGIASIAVTMTHTTLNLIESGHAAIAADGSWEWVPAFALVPGDYLVEATPVDLADNVGATATVTVTVV